MVVVSTECMHCSFCCGGSGGSGSGGSGGDGSGSGGSGGDGSGSGGSDGSADWTQYCNLHCVMGWCFFPKAVVHIQTECMHCKLCCGDGG